ncbi:GroES-like protein [Epithele typhae]|uniref:GroES-like protein n=1 Tax=Epithele typhae TaxID=378194 RepID=UPI0020077382|nr:GroES-like protein [Epithele typhae]KAH9921193.1 GroES-like protein [Epithele typhae]
MVPTTQKALINPAPGGGWKLHTTFPVPVPGAGEVQIKIMASSLNPGDWKIAAHGSPLGGSTYPWVGGLDLAGVVEAVGEGVDHLAVGDRVFSPTHLSPETSAWQEYCIQPAGNVAKIPDNIPFERAAGVAVPFNTCVLGLWNRDPGATAISLGLPAPWEEGGKAVGVGKAAFIVGGSTSVGQFAIQCARMNGFSSIVTTASSKHADWLKSLGATHVIDRALSEVDTLAELAKFTADTPVTLAFECVEGSVTERLAYQGLSLGGGLVCVNPMLNPAETFAEVKKDRDGKKVVKVFAELKLVPENVTVGVEAYKHVSAWLADGSLVPCRVEVLPRGLLGIPEGLERLARGVVSGVKLVARIAETL